MANDTHHDQGRASFRRLMAWTGAAALLAVSLAILYLLAQQGTVSGHVLVATALGAGGAILLGGLLMGLLFLSDRSGHDARVGGKTIDDAPGEEQE